MVARGACVVALGGHTWLLWGVCVVALGGMHGCSGGDMHGCSGGGHAWFRVPTRPGKPGKMRVHLENLEISWNLKKLINIMEK